jgi:acetyl esterase
VAPATIITAEHDILRGEAEAYARRLTSDGVDVEIIQYDGQLHGFFGLVGVMTDARDAAARAATALRRAFADVDPS